MKLVYTFLLVCIPLLVSAQDFSSVKRWQETNTADMGGRSVLLVYKDGKILYNQAVNKMTPRHKIATRVISRRMENAPDQGSFTSKTRLPIASCSKWLSAALVMSFVDEGRLSLSDTLGKYLPELSAAGKGGITISQCLSHTTGIRSPDLRESLDEMRNIGSMDEAVRAIAELPMEGAPGKIFRYGNTGLQLAGAVLERISKKSFDELFSERIAKPLKMKNTDFGNGKVALPAGGAYSTAEDYLNFLIMILNRGVFEGKRVLSEKSIAEMQINRITDDVSIAYTPTESKGFGYGFGEWIQKNTGIVTSPGLFGSFPWVDNEKGYCAVMICFYLNNQGRNERYRTLPELVEKQLLNN